jgi:aminoglycoside phosphotransferase family enzyme
MTQEEINRIIRSKAVPSQTVEISLIETHISWVLLTDSHVYKIKKPLKFSFLDFSTLEKRRLCCHQEVSLNSRLAPDMYLGVLPVVLENGRVAIDGQGGETVDYAVCMRRMDESRQMDLLMEQGLVEKSDLEALAGILADFHRTARKVPGGTSFEELLEEFTDIRTVIPFVNNHFGENASLLLETVNQWVPGFLERVRGRIQERDQEGFVIDGHGDLHCRNIFLLEPPLVFDCIEFNEDLRSLDMLNEIAFLCMDLERYGRPDLAEVFTQKYFEKNPIMHEETDQYLFLFFKMYRANVRIKVSCIHQLEETGPDGETKKEQDLIRQYLYLYEGYFRELRTGLG